jgi:hypothetical protein
MDDYTLERKIRDILDRHIKFVEYEGYDVNKEAVVHEMLQLVKNDKRREEKDTGGGNYFIGGSQL